MSISNLNLREIKNILLRGTTGSSLVRITSHGLRFALGVILARMLGPENFGMYTYAITLVALLSVLGILGMDHITIKYLTEYIEKKEWSLAKGIIKKSQSTVFVASIVILLISLLICYFFLSGYKNEIELNVIYFALLTIPLVVLSQTRQALCRALNRPVIAQFPENILYPSSILIIFLVAAYFLNDHNRVYYASVSNLLAWLIAWIVGLVLLNISIPDSVKLAASKSEFKKWVEMSPGVLFSTGAYLVLSKTDILIIDLLQTSIELGLYVAAARGAELMLFVYEVVTITGVSLFSSLYSTGDKKKLNEFVALMSRLILVGSTPILILFFVYTDSLLGFFGEQYIEAGDSFRVLVVAYFISSIGGFVIPMMYVVGRQKEVAVTIWIFVVVNFVLSYLFISLLGIIGAALAYGFCLIGMKAVLVYRLYISEGIVCLPFRINLTVQI